MKPTRAMVDDMTQAFYKFPAPAFVCVFISCSPGLNGMGDSSAITTNLVNGLGKRTLETPPIYVNTFF